MCISSKPELDAYLSIGGAFSRREIDVAVDMCRDARAQKRLQDNLQRVRLRQDGPPVVAQTKGAA